MYALIDVIMWYFPAAGIERTGNRVRRPTKFTVDTFSAGQGQVTIYLDHPDGTTEEVCLFLILCRSESCRLSSFFFLQKNNPSVWTCVLISWRQSSTRARRRSPSATPLKSLDFIRLARPKFCLIKHLSAHVSLLFLHCWPLGELVVFVS